MITQDMVDKAAQKLIELKHPAVRFRFSKMNAKDGVEDPLTYMGGSPTLPRDLSWPISRSDKRPLCFVAQFNLRSLPQVDRLSELPSRGILFFFSRSIIRYDLGFEGAVVFAPNVSENLPSRSPPDGVHEYWYNDNVEVGGVPTILEAPKRTLVARACTSYPNTPPGAADADTFDVYEEVSEWLDDQTNNAYLGDRIELADFPGMVRGWGQGGYQLLGYPMLTQYQQEELNRDHRLLLELGNVPAPPAPYDLAGLVQYWIKPNDLQNRRFDRVKQTIDTSG